MIFRADYQRPQEGTLMVDLSELDGILALRPRGDGGGPEENPER